jgi:PAS domain S-box-containing protein
MNIYTNILLEFLLISASILFLFKIRKKLGLAPLYILLGAVQYIQALSNTMIRVEIFGRFTIYPGSVILFSAVLFAVLLIYIKEGVQSARVLIIGIIISNFILSALFAITYHQELMVGTSQDVNAVSAFLINYKFFIVGTFILLIDFILLGIIYQFLISKIKKLNFFLIIFITLLSVLIFDAFAFNISLKYNSPELLNSIVGHIIGKSVSALIFAIILYVYLRFIDGDQKDTAFIANQKRDILSILTYKQKYLDLQIEKKQVESKLTSQLEATLNTISDGFVSLDTNWCYTFVNNKAGELLGRKPVDLIGKHIWTEFPDGVGLPFYNAYYKAVETQKNSIVVEYYEPVDRWFENKIYPTPEGLTIYFSDITENRKAALALKESENHIRTILETEPECIKQINAKGELIYMNPAGLAMIEAENLDLVKGQSIIGLILPEHQKAFKELNNTIFKGQSGRLEFEIIGLKGTKRWLETHAVPFKDTDGNIISLLGVTRDVTDRKLSETALIKSEQYLENIINNIGDPVFVKDEQSNLLLVNDAFCKIFKLSKQDIFGKTLAENVTEDERESFLRIDRQVLETGIENVNEETLSIHGEETRIISTKKTRFIDDSGTKFLIGTIRDITGRKKAEKTIKESEEKFSKVFHSSQVGFSIVNMDQITVDVNDAMARLVESTREHLIGKTVEEAGVDVMDEAYYEQQNRLMKKLEQNGFLSNEIINKTLISGKELSCLMSVEIIEVLGVPHILTTALDITAKKIAEDELEKHRNNLEELVKLRTQEVDTKNEELRRMNKLFVGRELKMKELKNRIKELVAKWDNKPGA